MSINRNNTRIRNNLVHEMVHINRWTPDVRSEVPDCPTPVIERYLIRSAIESCERARIWRWNLPEIPVEIDRTLYELETPNNQSCIHSILSVEYDNRIIQDNTEEIGSRGQELYYSTQNGTQAYHVPDRGFIELTRRPLQDSQPVRSEFPPVVPPEPVDPGMNGGTVTPEDMAEFERLVAEREEAQEALRVWNSLENRTNTGIFVCASIKPERDALEIPLVIFKDYYDLILNGALYRLMQMQGQKWTDKQQSNMYRKEYEIDLNRTRQQIDRGFNTKSQRIQPRRYI